MSKLSPKQELFIQEYLKDFNGTQAAIRSGYSKKTANEQAARLLAKVSISTAIADAMKDRSDRVKVDSDWVLKQAVKLHERCMQEVKPVLDGVGCQVRDENGNALFVFDAKAAVASLRVVGDHVNIQAFAQKHIHEHKLKTNVERIDRIAEVLRAAEDRLNVGKRNKKD